MGQSKMTPSSLPGSRGEREKGERCRGPASYCLEDQVEFYAPKEHFWEISLKYAMSLPQV